jgi:SNF2 family DNA or RNA helicase
MPLSDAQREILQAMADGHKMRSIKEAGMTDTFVLPDDWDKDLKNFQAVTHTKLVRDKAHLVLFRMGLGKTPTTTKAMHTTRQEYVLILCPKNAIRVWEDHIKEWFAGLDKRSGISTPYFINRWRGKYNNTQKRHAQWQIRVPNAMNIFIMTYAGYVSDIDVLPQHFHVIINDEAKRIRNRKSKAFLYLKKMVKAGTYYWPMTGTPGKLPADLFTMLHLCDPKYFSSYWKFVNAFHYTIKNQWSGTEILGVKNADAWYQTLNRKASIVTKDMVKDQIGASTKHRQKLYVEMDDCQEKLYNELITEMMSETPNGDLILASTSLVRTLRLRQTLVCPKILSSSLSYGAAIEDLVVTLQDTDPHVVIFTPFTEAIPHFKERLAQAGYRAFGIQGGMSPDELVQTIEAYRKCRGIAICSIRYATAFSLEPAADAFFIGYEWDPDDNDQAEDRLQRMTTTYPINAWYYTHEHTYEEEQLQHLLYKRRLTGETIFIPKVGLKF